MALEPNIILSGAPPQDPFATVNKLVGLKQAVLQNQSAQQVYDANVGIGRAYQGAIDPNTGQLDTNKLISLASQDPTAAFKTGELVAAAQARQKEQVGIDQAEFDLKKNQIATFSGALGPLAANPKATREDYMRRGAEFVQQGLLSKDGYLQLMSSLPTDPAKLNEWAKMQYASLLDADKQLGLLYGKPKDVDTGPNILTGVQNQLTGAFTPGTTIGKGLTPSDASSTVPYVDANGVPRVMTKAQFAAKQGQGGEGLATGLAPGQSEAMTTAATDNAKQGQATLAAAEDTRMNVMPLIKHAKGLLPNITTGPNAETAKLVGAFAQQFGIEFKGSKDGTADAEVMSKVLEQISGRQAQALAAGGNNTDAKLASAKNATPNIHMSKLGLQGALATVEGLANATTLKGMAYQSYLDNGGTPAGYSRFVNSFNKTVDPFVLQVDALPPAEKARVFKSMTPKEHKEYNEKKAILDRVAASIGWKP